MVGREAVWRPDGGPGGGVGGATWRAWWTRWRTGRRCRRTRWWAGGDGGPLGGVDKRV